MIFNNIWNTIFPHDLKHEICSKNKKSDANRNRSLITIWLEAFRYLEASYNVKKIKTGPLNGGLWKVYQGGNDSIFECNCEPSILQLPKFFDTYH